VVTSRAELDSVVKTAKPEFNALVGAEAEVDSGQTVYRSGSPLRLADGRKFFLPRPGAGDACVASAIRFLQPMNQRECVVKRPQRDCDSRWLHIEAYVPDVRVDLAEDRAAAIKINFFKVKRSKKAGESLETVDNIQTLTFSETLTSGDLFEEVERLPSPPPRIGPVLRDGKCLNAVMAVRYKVKWRNDTVRGVEVNLLIGDSPAKAFTLTTDVTFSHTAASQPEKPGNPGYDRGKPILAGKGQLAALPSPSADGLCRNAESQPVLFGRDVAVGCDLVLASEDLLDCRRLRKDVRTLLMKLVPKELAKGGSPQEDANFVQVLLDDDDLADDEANETLTATMGPFRECSIQAEVRLEILYTTADAKDGSPIHRLAAAVASTRPHVWRWRCDTAGGCGRPRRFGLLVSATFAELPLVWRHENTSRFWLDQGRRPCAGDTCWREMAYPFQRASTGDDVSYVTAWSIVLAAFTFVLIFFTSNYW